MYAMNNVWTVFKWSRRNTKDTQQIVNMGMLQPPLPPKKHVSQETGLDWTWSEELAPNALTWAQKIPQLNEPMHGSFSSNHIQQKTSKTYQIPESKPDSPKTLGLKNVPPNGCLESLIDTSYPVDSMVPILLQTGTPTLSQLFIWGYDSSLELQMFFYRLTGMHLDNLASS